MKGLWIVFVLALFLLPLSSASTDYLTHRQNSAFNLTVQSNNATACNLSYIQYPNGMTALYNIPLVKNGNTFIKLISPGNYSQLGFICHGITCTDGASNEVGSICRQVTPSGFKNILGFSIIIFVLLYLITFVGAYFENAPVTILGGLGLLALGIFSVNNGIDVYRNAITDVISITTIGLGGYFSISGGLKLIQEYM